MQFNVGLICGANQARCIPRALFINQVRLYLNTTDVCISLPAACHEENIQKQLHVVHGIRRCQTSARLLRTSAVSVTFGAPDYTEHVKRWREDVKCLFWFQ